MRPMVVMEVRSYTSSLGRNLDGEAESSDAAKLVKPG
jgi:hypothetical protein